VDRKLLLKVDSPERDRPNESHLDPIRHSANQANADEHQTRNWIGHENGKKDKEQSKKDASNPSGLRLFVNTMTHKLFFLFFFFAHLGRIGLEHLAHKSHLVLAQQANHIFVGGVLSGFIRL
jgi:hypothetical protein